MSTSIRTEDAAITQPTLSGQRVCGCVAVSKPSLDLAMTALALMLMAPLWPLIALAIRIDSPGPALFRQLRVGRSLPDPTKLFVEP